MIHACMFLGILLLSNTSLLTAQQIVAHQGLWKNDESSAPNSITSLKKAQDAGFYASEFDIYFTSDDVAVVYHNSIINGIDIQKSKYNEIKNFQLGNGEKLPTLEDYLKAGAKNKKTRLFLEIKTHPKVVSTRNIPIMLDLIDKYGMMSQIDFISFDRHICLEIRKHNPDALVLYLNGDLTPQEVKEMNLSGIDYSYTRYLPNMNWISEARKLGLKTGVWTINDVGNMKRFIEQKIDYITTDYPFILEEVLNSYSAITEKTPDQGVTIFPNPVKDRIFIRNTDPETTIHIYSGNGCRVYSGKIDKDSSVDFSDYSPGYYFLQAGTERKTFIKK